MDRLNEFLKTYKLPIALSFVGVVLIIGGLFLSNLPNLPNRPNSFPKESLISKENLSKSLKVDISGAIYTPGVHTLAKDSRVEDVIKAAKGFLQSADSDYISKKLNLSAKLIDGQKLYIPFTGENYQSAQLGAQVAGASTGEIIGLNSGSNSELESLPGIGPVTAQKIIDSRPYSDINELLIRKVVSRSVFEKIKDKINLN